jgi:hypothetical protein
MSGTSVPHFRDYADIIGVDFYPVPWAPLSQFGKEMKLARFALRDQPYLAIIQAFDWSAFPSLLDTNQPLRPPTFDELRCMAYMALAQGAKGLLFYTCHSAGWRLLEHELWSDLKGVIREVNDRLPLFTARHVWWSPDSKYLDGPESMHNEVRDGKVQLRLLEVTKGNHLISRGRYALALNTTADQVAFRFELPHSFSTVPVLGAAPAPLSDRHIVRDFAPYEVICYGPLIP